MDIVSTLSQHVYVTLHIPSHITSYMSTRLSCATPHAEKNIIITLHDTTELQHVHNPTAVLHT